MGIFNVTIAAANVHGQTFENVDVTVDTACDYTTMPREMLDIYVAMVIGDWSKTRDFSEQVALERCKEDVRTAITYVLDWVETAAPAGLEKEAKHRTIMQQLRGMPIEMLDRTYNWYRIENHGINLDDHPDYRTYQTFFKMGIAPPSHEQMADIIIIKALT